LNCYAQTECLSVAKIPYILSTHTIQYRLKLWHQ